MTDLLLAKPELPSDVTDVSVGEPHLVRDIFLDTFNLFPYELSNIPGILEYPYPSGYKKLVSLLEAKHNAPVIITNGAKQALAATFYALKQMGYNKVGMKLPYWALLPPLANMHNMESVFEDPSESPQIPYLLLAPNNPDGQCDSFEKLKQLSNLYKEKNIPFIHDAAYYTHAYIPSTYKLQSLGDIQIYSISKYLGLSGLRLGYCVIHNTKMYKYIQAYMEAMTVGVSNISQHYLFNILNMMDGYPSLVTSFENKAFEALQARKKQFKELNCKSLIVPDNIESVYGMFLFCKVPDFSIFNKAKINVADGKFFGMENYARINLAFHENSSNKIFEKLKSVLSEVAA